MVIDDWITIIALIIIISVTAPFFGKYIAHIFDDSTKKNESIFGRIEKPIFRFCGINRDKEQTWQVYARAVIAFSCICVFFVYIIQRIQNYLPFNPTHAKGVNPFTAFNTSVSFVTNTNWQNYSGETTMSHLTQMLVLAVQNFLSAGVGLAIAIALVRGLIRVRTQTIGNFWVDLVRGTIRLLLPLAFIFAIALVGMGVIQNTHGNRTYQTTTHTSTVVPGGMVASQESIKELGTNGGGFYNANSAHPFENPSGVTNFLEIYLLLIIPFSLPFTFGFLAGNIKEGIVIFAAMFLLWLVSALGVMHFETGGNSHLTSLGVTQKQTAHVIGGNMEGKETRFGSGASGLFGASTTSTSTGAVDSAHDSFTAAGGGIVLANIMLGEVSPGGVGSGLYGMLIFAVLAVFIAGLMVGRTPEYLGKKIQAAEMKLVTIYLLVVPIVVLVFASISVIYHEALASRTNLGPHGLTEIVYAFTSAGNNNGSAFAGLNGATHWYNITLGICMLIGRFWLIIPVLAIAGSLGAKQRVPKNSGTFPTATPLFAFLLVGVVVIVVGLTYFPVLALGPIVEHLGL